VSLRRGFVEGFDGGRFVEGGAEGVTKDSSKASSRRQRRGLRCRGTPVEGLPSKDSSRVRPTVEAASSRRPFVERLPSRDSHRETPIERLPSKGSSRRPFVEGFVEGRFIEGFVEGLPSRRPFVEGFVEGLPRQPGLPSRASSRASSKASLTEGLHRRLRCRGTSSMRLR